MAMTDEEFAAKYPQHAKAAPDKDKIYSVAEFVDTGGWVIGRWECRTEDADECDECLALNADRPEQERGEACEEHERERPFFMPAQTSPEQIAAAHFGIDYRAYQAEKDAMYRELFGG